MEYVYLRELDKIVENKDKLKEVIEFLLKKSIERYNDYEADDLYYLFCNEKIDNFLDVIHNMYCYESRILQFGEYIHHFPRKNMVDLKDKMYFLLGYNFKITYEKDDPTFIEYLFRYDSYEISEYIEAVIEYYINELPVLIDKIKNFNVFKPEFKDFKHHLIVNFTHSIEYLNQKNLDGVKIINMREDINIDVIKNHIKELITLLNDKIEIMQQHPKFCNETLQKIIKYKNNNYDEEETEEDDDETETEDDDSDTSCVGSV
jgi:hypothetical protein